MERLKNLGFDLNFLLWIPAIVTHFVTIVVVVVLAEVVQQKSAAASGSFGVGHDLAHQLGTHFSLRHGLIAQEFFESQNILIAVKSDAGTIAAVAAGAAGLLVVIFNTFGDIEVDDKAYIRLVDPHAKGDGSDDDIDLFHEEIILGLVACLGIETSMIRCSLYIIDL